MGSRAPGTKSRKGRRRYLKRLNAHRETFIPQAWQALMQAETDFAEAQAALAAVPIAGMDDFKTMIVSAELYDDIELCRINRSPISRAVVAHVAEMARGGSHEQRHQRRGQESDCERRSAKGRRPAYL